MLRKTLLWAFVCLIGISGCTTSPYGIGKTTTEYSDHYAESEQGFASTWINYTRSQRNIVTEIQGNPFGMDKEVFDLVTAQVLTAQTPGPRMMFQPKVFMQDLPGQAPREQYRFVIVFNPMSPVSGKELCQGADVPTGRSLNNSIGVRAAFCRGETMLSSAASFMPQVASVRDHGFARVISKATSSIFRRKPGNFAKGDNYDLPYDTSTEDVSWGCDRWLDCGLNNRLASPE